MTLLGGAIGLLLGVVLGAWQLQLQGLPARIVAGLGGLLLAGGVYGFLSADNFTRGFWGVYLLVGAVLTLLASLPRLLLRSRRPEPLWVGLGLGAALVGAVVLVGLGADGLLGGLLPGPEKAQASSGMVPGLLIGTVLGLGWGWYRLGRRPPAGA